MERIFPTILNAIQTDILLFPNARRGLTIPNSPNVRLFKQTLAVTS